MSKLQDKDIKRAIYSSKKAVTTKVEKQITEPVYYTFFDSREGVDSEGFPIAKELNDDVLAKLVPYGSRLKFYIKTDTWGNPYNPIGLYTNEKDNDIPMYRNREKKREKFIEVTEITFNFYIQFLKTKNSLWLTKANQER